MSTWADDDIKAKDIKRYKALNYINQPIYAKRYSVSNRPLIINESNVKTASIKMISLLKDPKVSITKNAWTLRLFAHH